jgi:hypothetical protein
MVGGGYENPNKKRRIEVSGSEPLFPLLLRIPNTHRKFTAPSPALAAIAFVDDMLGSLDRARVKASSEIVTGIQNLNICTNAHNY